MEDKEKDLFSIMNELEEKREDDISVNVDDLNKIPDDFKSEGIEVPKSDLIDTRKEIKLGLTSEDLKELYDYLSGKGEKPLFIDKFTSDTEGRLKDTVYIMCLLQLSRIPTLTALQAQVQELMFRPENLSKMDVKDLSIASKNIMQELQGILKGTTDMMETFSGMGSMNSEYRRILDRLMLLPPETLSRVLEIIDREQK